MHVAVYMQRRAVDLGQRAGNGYGPARAPFIVCVGVGVERDSGRG